MTLRRLAILQWTGLLAGGAAWFGAHVIGYGLTQAECNSGGAHWGIANDAWEAALLGTSAVLIALAALAALIVFRGTSDTSYEAEPPASRIRFFAIAALAADTIFLVIVVLDAAGNLFDVACRQA